MVLVLGLDFVFLLSYSPTLLITFLKDVHQKNKRHEFPLSIYILGKSFDVQYIVSPMTLDVILLSAFGVETDVQTNPESELLSRSKRVFQRPTGTFFRILPALPLGWLFRKIIFFFREQPLAYFQSLALRIVDTRRQEMEQGTVKRIDLLQLMLNARQKETSEERTHRKLSDEEITAQSVVFMLAGHETTSNAICFTAYYLALNPEVQERLRTEIETAVVVSGGLQLHK